MDSTQTKHICGCRSHTAEPALSSLLPSKHYPCSPAAPPLGTPTCLGAAVLAEDALKRLFICSQMATGRGIATCPLYAHNLQGHL